MGDSIRELEERLLRLSPEERDTTAEVDVLNRLGWFLVAVDHRRATELFERARRLSEELDYALGCARAILGGAFDHFFKADYGGALAKARESAPVLRERGSSVDRANVLLLEGLVYWSLGDFEVALDTLKRCYDIARECDDDYNLGWALTSLGSIHAELGDLDKAVDLQKRSIEQFRATGNVVGEGRASSGLGMVYLRQRRFDDALEVQRRSLALSSSVGSELSAARALNDMGVIHQAQGDSDSARKRLEEALAIRERFENWPAVVTTLLALGKLDNDFGRPAEAEKLLERAAELSEKLSTRPKLWQALEGLSRSCELQGKFREALAYQRRAQTIKEEVQGEEMSTRLKNLQIQHEVETHRLRNVELAGALEQLKQAQSQLVHSEKMAAIGHLVAGVAHELNNPLSALACGMDIQVRAAARVRELTAGGTTTDPRALERALDALVSGAESAVQACERIAKLVRSLQTFSQLDHSEFRRIDIREGIESTIDLVRAQFGDRVEWVSRLEEIPAIECFPGALNQTLMTLLVNAVEAMDGSGTVTVATSAADGWVRLEVSDTGSGIEPDRLESLFEIGFSRSGERVRMSTGLANVRAAVDRHHGRISVDSEPGRGTTFEILLPVRQPSSGTSA